MRFTRRDNHLELLRRHGPARRLIGASYDAGLDETVARELAPRHAFARACRKLSERRIIRAPWLKTSTAFGSEFTAESKVGDRFEYKLETLLTLEKSTGKVCCDLPGLATLAQEHLDECIAVRTGADVTRTIQRLFERNADLFPIREKGGCYFSPVEHAAFLDRIDRFVKALNGNLRRFPVPAGTAHGDRSVKEAVASGLAALIEEHRQAIAGFGEDTRSDTIERAAERIRITRHKVGTTPRIWPRSAIGWRGAGRSQPRVAERVEKMAEEPPCLTSFAPTVPVCSTPFQTHEENHDPVLVQAGAQPRPAICCT
jgi:hypothetical protein